MNRRKFIKTGLQAGGAGLMASTLGCQGSLFDAFDSSAEEAFLISATRFLYKVNLVTGAASIITPVFTNQLLGLALRGQNTALVLDNVSPGNLFSVNLKDNSVTTLASSVASINPASIALENQESAIVGDTGTLTRLNLSTLASSTIVSGLVNSVAGLAMESSQSVLVQLGNGSGNLLRVKLSSGTSNLLRNIGTTSSKITFASDRNLVLIANSDTVTPTQIRRLDLSTNTLLSDIGFLTNGAGPGIALENSHSVLVGSNTSGGLYRVDLDTGVTSRVDDGSLGGVIIVDIAVRFQ